MPFWSGGTAWALPHLPADEPMVEHRMAEVLALAEIHARLPAGAPVLAYVLPVDYVMQGMIADTHTFGPTLINDIRLNYTRGRFSNRIPRWTTCSRRSRGPESRTRKASKGVTI